MFRFLNFTLIIFHFSLFSAFGQSPSRIELQHADISEFDEAINPNADRLIGHVSFKHENAIMTCDSAFLYKKENNLEAFGNVRINQGDTLFLNGRHLVYTGDSRFAQMTKDVVMTDRKMKLNTSRLDYNMNDDIAYYTDSAHIADDENVLTSKRGYYYSKSHDMFFRYDVALTNSKFTLTCDTLRYNTYSKTAFFLGPTYIHSKEDLIYCEKGWYNTDLQTSLFTTNASLKTKGQILKGDTVKYDRIKGIGICINNVSIFDSANKVTITGDYGEHHEIEDSSFVTGHATMIQAYQKDTLFMHGDTLKAVKTLVEPVENTEQKLQQTQRATKADSTSRRNLHAYHHVRIFKNDLQGVCDSLVYNYSDSTIYMYSNPVLWSGLNQLTADSIALQTANSNIDKMHLVNSAFIISRADSLQTGPDDSLKFNQIRGKNMTGYFSDNKLYKIDVKGNGQTVYYTKNKNQKIFGVNRADCSDLLIHVSGNKVEQISLLNQPDGALYPVKEITLGELRLKGFIWRDQYRPKNKDDIYSIEKK